MRLQIPAGEYTCRTPHIVWGPGTAATVGDHLARLGSRRALLLSSRTVGASEWVQRLKMQLDGLCAGAYLAIEPHTPIESLADAIACAKEQSIDAIVAIGGGAVVDAGKLVALALAEGEDFEPLRIRWTSDRRLQIPTLTEAKLPVIAIPTTLAAAEVVGAAAYVKDEQRFVVVDPGLLPRVVIYDAEVAATTPTPLFLGTGINAIAHCVEALCSSKAQPFSQALALGALEGLVRSMRQCFAAPEDLHARQDAQVAAAMSGVAYTGTWLGIAHSLCQALGARFRAPQGALHSVILPHAIRFNLPATSHRQEALCGAIARGMGQPQPFHAGPSSDASGMVVQFTRSLRLPQRLRELGIPPAGLGGAADDAFTVWHTYFNPRNVKDARELRGVLRAAW